MRRILFGTAALLSACAPSIAPERDTGEPVDSGAATLTDDADPRLKIDGDAWNLDASDTEAWVPVDLDQQAVLEGSADLYFRRFEVELAETTWVGWVDDTDFDSFDGRQRPPLVQQIDDVDDDGEPDSPFADWYDYDPTTHILTPKPRVYVVETDENRSFKLQFDSYYDTYGTPALLSLRVAELNVLED